VFAIFIAFFVFLGSFSTYCLCYLCRLGCFLDWLKNKCALSSKKFMGCTCLYRIYGLVCLSVVCEIFVIFGKSLWDMCI
jgi:hypothetical protein